MMNLNGFHCYMYEGYPFCVIKIGLHITTGPTPNNAQDIIGPEFAYLNWVNGECKHKKVRNNVVDISMLLRLMFACW